MKYVARVMFVLLLGSLFFFVMNCSPAGQACDENNKCPDGQVCSAEGKCVSKSGTDGGGGEGVTEKPQATPCTSDLNCESDEFCKDKKCTKLPDSCEKTEDCGDIRYCDPADKKCKDIVCKFDDQCPDAHACNTTTGKCEPAKACKDSAECPNGWTCNTCRGTCTVSLGTGRCNEDFNCPGGIELEWCDKCIKECRPRQKLCSPCVKDDQCGDTTDHCLPDQRNPQSGRKFCGRECQQGIFCAPGFKCKDFPDLKTPKQCVPVSGDCDKPGECETNADCVGAGKICDPGSKRCVAGCEGDANCPVRTQEACTTDQNCKNPNAKCTGGSCVVQLSCCRGRCGVPCSSDSECEQNESCTDGCCAVEGECTTSRDCQDKEYCDQTTGLCTPGCQTAQDCGLPDPKKNRCRFKCVSNKCEEDCSCRNPHLDCTPVKFCPKDQTDPNAPCRKPIGPVCKSCSGNKECACKDGDDCKYICEKRECKADTDCADMPGGATKCYNDRCSTKKACRSDADCPAALNEKCENGFCAENCHNQCVNLQSGARCFTGCDPRGDGTECPSRLICSELLPQSASGPKCKSSTTLCQQDSDCTDATQNKCGPDGYCTSCGAGKVCRNLNQDDPNDLICIPMPQTVCGDFSGVLCKEAGF